MKTVGEREIDDVYRKGCLGERKYDFWVGEGGVSLSMTKRTPRGFVN